jgi:thioredoxin 1
MASPNVVEFTTANWEQEVLKSDKPVLVDFWAVWCGPCRMLAPTIDKVADQFAGKVKVGKLDTGANPEIAIRYGISAIPVVLLFKGGQQLGDKLTGAQNISAYVTLLNRVLENGKPAGSAAPKA